MRESGWTVPPVHVGPFGCGLVQERAVRVDLRAKNQSRFAGSYLRGDPLLGPNPRHGVRVPIGVLTPGGVATDFVLGGENQDARAESVQKSSGSYDNAFRAAANRMIFH